MSIEATSMEGVKKCSNWMIGVYRSRVRRQEHGGTQSGNPRDRDEKK